MPIDVIIVEDDSRLRSGLVEIVNRDPQCVCVGAFGSGEEAVQKAPALKPQVAVMDINLPGMDGIECVRQQIPEHSSSPCAEREPCRGECLANICPHAVLYRART